ncbi:MAG: SpoIIE family protein phosphatase [Candidimonas sp.]|nr:SpoIIE family protein phosphatase [Candidimonas sp.]
MRLTSLRSKIFLLVGLTLLLGAIAVMAVTERDVTRTVVASEERAVGNVLNLLLRDSEARWGGLLTDKITTVRNGRSQLVQLGNTVRSVLQMYASQAQDGQLSVDQAKGAAVQWINKLAIDEARFSFAFDHNLIALASGRPDWRGMNLSNLQDFKGNDLATSAYHEARTTGQSFAIYQSPTRDGNEGKFRYAYFGYFEPWDWVFAITDEAQTISRQFDTRRQEMEQSIREALASLTLARNGFAFIVDDEGGMIAPLPARHAGLLDEKDTSSTQTLRKLLDDISESGEVSTFTLTPQAEAATWQISAAYFKPLRWTIAAAVPADDLTHAAEQLRNRLAWLFVGVLLVSLAIAWALSARITRPLKQLTEFARALPEQDLSTAGPIPPHIAQLPQRQPDEVGRLAATFMFMDEQLREKIAKLVQETSSRERFESELNIAHTIQMGLLPQPLEPGALKQLDLYATMIPAKEVGGDLYDYFVLPDGRLCFAIGDVSDKGVPAALFMAVTRTLIRASAEGTTDPAMMIERINNRLSENNPNMMFVTLIVAVLDMTTGDLTWANAGHPPPCIVKTDGELRLLEGCSGPACGVQEDLPYTRYATQLAQGETFIGYSDGVTEALSPDGKLYGDQRLLDLLAAHPAPSAQLATTTVLDDVRAFAHGTEQSDDITLIAARRAAS